MEGELEQRVQGDSVHRVGDDEGVEVQSPNQERRQDDRDSGPEQRPRQSSREPKDESDHEQGLEVEGVALEHERGHGRREGPHLDEHPEHRSGDDRQESALGTGGHDAAETEPEKHDQRTYGYQPDGETKLRQMLDCPANGRDKRVVRGCEPLVGPEPGRKRRPLDLLVDDIDDESSGEEHGRRPEPT